MLISLIWEFDKAGDILVGSSDGRITRRAERRDAGDLTRLASALWPDHNLAELSAEMDGILMGDEEAAFICMYGDKPAGFAHCTLRRDYVEGSEESPTAYLEGIFVVPEHRGEGIASELLMRCEGWALEMGCAEIASDCELGNLDSERFHLRSGFSEANRVICFIKRLKT